MTLPPDNIKLFNRIREDDFIAFETVFKKYYKSLCVFAEHYVGEPEMAKEIVSDFFLKIWENRRNIQINTSVKNYCYTSIRNQSLKYLEHLKVLKKYKEYAENRIRHIQFMESVSGDYPLANLISQEIVEEIETSIDVLPERCKEIFMLSRFEDMSYEDISKKLDVSINTVRKQMSRALEKLRNSLSKYLPITIFMLLQFFIK